MDADTRAVSRIESKRLDPPSSGPALCRYCDDVEVVNDDTMKRWGCLCICHREDFDEQAWLEAGIITKAEEQMYLDGDCCLDQCPECGAEVECE